MNKPPNRFAPVRRTQAALASKSVAARRQPLFTMEFYVCFVSFSLLLYSVAGGTWAIVGFLAPWALIVANQFRNVQQALIKYWLLFLLPALVTLSAIWSDDPHKSFRGGLELAATVGIGIMAGACVRPKTFIPALLFTLILTAVLCILAGHTEIISTTGETAYTGIFNSKNAFSGMMSLLFLVSISVYMDKSQAFLFRTAALGGALLTPILIYYGRSLDSTLAVCFTLAVFMSVRFLSRFKPKARLAICLLIFVLAISVTLFASLTEFSSATLLHSMGKESTLTGRTWLWGRAMDFSGDNPFLGVGAGAFWRLDNPRAQELWYGMHVLPGAGLGFHNEYINMLVDLGIVGLFLILGYFFVLTKWVMKCIMGTMNAEQSFAFLLFTYFLIRTPVETGIFGQFSVAMILFCIFWIYLRPPDSPARLRKFANLYDPKNDEVVAR